MGSETSQASYCWGQSPARHSAPFPGSSCWSPERGDLNPSRRQSAQPGHTNCRGVTARPRHQASGTQTTRSSESPFAQAVGTGRPGRQGLGPHRASCPGRREHRAAPGQGLTSRSHRDSSGTSHRRVAAAQGLPGRGYPLLGDISPEWLERSSPSTGVGFTVVITFYDPFMKVFSLSSTNIIAKNDPGGSPTRERGILLTDGC